MVQTAVGNARNIAKLQVAYEFPDVGDAIKAGWAQRAAALKGQ